MNTDTQQKKEKEIIHQLFGIREFQPPLNSAMSQAISVSEFNQIVKSVIDQLGELKTVNSKPPSFELEFERGKAIVQIGLDSEDRIAGFRILNVSEGSKKLPEILESIKALPGDTSFYIAKDGNPLYTHRENDQLQCASSYKVALLKALEQKIAKTDLTWETVVKIEESHLSYPTGIMHQWPIDSPLTLHTAATLMMSLSDNTAADLIHSIVDKEDLNKLLPDNREFLTSRQYFYLSNPFNDKARQQYLSKNDKWQSLANERVSTNHDPKIEFYDDVGWYASTKQLSNIMDSIDDPSFLQVIQPPFSLEGIEQAAFKGGESPSVLSSVFQFKLQGVQYVVSFNWNNKAEPVDRLEFFSLIRDMVTALVEQESS